MSVDQKIATPSTARRDPGLTHKRAMVAGAGNGIGRAIALTLARAGATIICADLDETRAKAVEREIIADGGRAYAFAGDLIESPVVQRLLDFTLAKMEGADIVIDVIGGAIWSGIIEASEDVWTRNFSLNALHNLHVMKLFGKQMIAQGSGGAFVHIASVNGFLGQPGNFACAAAKASLVSMIRTAALEFAPHGIRVNGVAPGAIDTSRLRDHSSQRFLDALAASVPMGRLAHVQEIADAALFLASDLASYITAQTLVVDGGAMAKFPFPHPSEVDP